MIPPISAHQADVYAFMKGVGQDTPFRPVIPDAKTRALRIALLAEEVKELADASGVGFTFNIGTVAGVADPAQALVNVADAIADILYVAHGAAVAYGLDIQPVWDEVQRSNMSKVTNGHKDEKTGKWVKGPGYSPANLAPIVADQVPPSGIPVLT
jgi:predicted HAD superfamily Cof-like phosphohydrolase